MNRSSNKWMSFGSRLGVVFSLLTVLIASSVWAQATIAVSNFGDSYFYRGASTSASAAVSPQDANAFDVTNTTGWMNGRTAIGFGSASGFSLGTMLQGVGANARYVTGTTNHHWMYFKKSFTVGADFNANNITSVTGTHRIDDALIIYVNGIEVYRFNVGTANSANNVRIGDDVTWNAYQGNNLNATANNFNINNDYNNVSLGASNVSGSGNLYHAASLTNLKNALKTGTNVITCAVGNNSNTSSDLWFDLKLDIVYTPVVGPIDPPTLDPSISRVVATINGDPRSEMGFNWMTSSTAQAEVQIVEGACANPATCFNVSTVKKFSASPVGTSGTAANYRRAKATGLTANTTYSYRVGSTQAGWSSVGTFKTAPANNGNFSFIYSTDPQAGNQAQFQYSGRTINKAVERVGNRAGFWLLTGDHTDDNSENEWNWYFQEQRNAFNSLPFAPVIGGHDGFGNNYSNPPPYLFDKIFNTPSPGSSLSPAPNFAGSIYSFVYGDAIFFALNFEITNVTNWANYYKPWMQAEIARQKAALGRTDDFRWKIVYSHMGLFTRGGYNATGVGNYWNDLKNIRDQMAPVYEELGIDLQIHGHSHVYELAVVKTTGAGDANQKLIDAKHISTDADGFEVYNLIDGGTVYFNNSTMGNKKYDPKVVTNENVFRKSIGLGSSGSGNNTTYSVIDVSNDAIKVETYKVQANTANVTDELFERFTVVKGTAPPVGPPDYAAPEGSPVYKHGWLEVRGNRIVGSRSGEVVQLRGVSSYAWGSLPNAATVRWLADDWKINVIRAGVMNINANSASEVIQAAIEKGIYVIVDYHTHNASQSSAISGFSGLANKYKNNPNVMFEIFNEPCPGTDGGCADFNNWTTQLKPYSENVINAIRGTSGAGHDKHIVIAGTPDWSQGVDIATANPLSGRNIAYSFHFYASAQSHHRLWEKGQVALNRGYAIIGTEIGVGHWNMRGPLDPVQIKTWFDWLDENKVGYATWTLNNNWEDNSIVRENGSMSTPWATGGDICNIEYMRARNAYDDIHYNGQGDVQYLDPVPDNNRAVNRHYQRCTAHGNLSCGGHFIRHKIRKAHAEEFGYKVTFDLNGGVGTAPAPKFLVPGDRLGAYREYKPHTGFDANFRTIGGINSNTLINPEDWLTMPSTNGYTKNRYVNVSNGKWYKDKACTQEYVPGTAINSDMTLYLKWELDPNAPPLIALNAGSVQLDPAGPVKETGKSLEPKIVVGGKTLVKGVDYNIEILSGDFVNAGTVTFKVVALDGSDYEGSVELSLVIEESDNRTVALSGFGDRWSYFAGSMSTADALTRSGWTDNAVTPIGFGSDIGLVSTKTTLANAVGANARYVSGTNNHHWTHFKKEFELADDFDPANLLSAFGTHKIDDALIIYVNGTEVYRYNVGTSNSVNSVTLGGSVNWSAYNGNNQDPRDISFAIDGENVNGVLWGASNVTGNLYHAWSFDRLKNVLKSGTNVITCAVGQNSAGSSDMYFDLDLNITYERGEPIVIVPGVLVSIAQPEAIIDVKNGVAKTAEGLGLPTTVNAVVTNDGVETNSAVPVTWDVDASIYDPAVETAQTFTVSGTVVLPEDITNDNNVELAVSVNVSVLAKPLVVDASLSGFGDRWSYFGGSMSTADALTRSGWTDNAVTPIGFGSDIGLVSTKTTLANAVGANARYVSGTNNHHWTHFKKEFELADDFDPANLLSAFGTHKVDDALIIYVNGTEVYRYNVGTSNNVSSVTLGGNVNWSAYNGNNQDPRDISFAIDGENVNGVLWGASNVTGNLYHAWSFDRLKNVLKSGTNVITCAVGQNSAGSSDMYFDLDLNITYERGKIIDEPIIVWGDWEVTTPATCDEDGVETRTANNGDTETRAIAKGEWSEWVVTVEPSYEAVGVESRTCSINGTTENREIPALEIVWGDWEETTPATCDEDGVETRTANNGDTETRAIAKGEWSEWVVTVEPSYEAVGVESRTCSINGTTENREIPALEIVWGDWKVTTPATCDEDGVETRTANSGATETRTIAKGEWSDWVVTTPATYEAVGIETRTCSINGTTETREIPQLQGIAQRWSVDEKKYPGNMTVYSVIALDGVELRSDRVEVGAFDDNGVVRGSAMLEHQSNGDRYAALLMIYGVDGDEIVLKVYDHENGIEYETQNDMIVFENNNRLGNPYEIRISSHSSPTYALTYTAGGGGRIVGTSSQAVEKYANGTEVRAEAEVGYEFTNWSDGRTDNPRTDSNVRGNIRVTAYFKYVATDPAVVTQDLNLGKGWNWISVNVLNDNPSILDQLKTELGDAGVQIKSQTGATQQVSGAGWISGGLSGISETEMYKVNVSNNVSVTLEGRLADVSTPISIRSGWNHIGYLPSYTLSARSVVDMLTPRNGDQIKGQNGAAQYVENLGGWVATPWFDMSAGNGYMYYSTGTGTQQLVYPSRPQQALTKTSRALSVSSSAVTQRWIVDDVHAYQNSMTVLAVVTLGDEVLRNDKLEIAAFYGEEVRGSAVVEYFAAGDKYAVLMMVHGNSDEDITLKVYDHDVGKEYTVVNESLKFVSDMMYGTSEFYQVALDMSTSIKSNDRTFSVKQDENATVIAPSGSLSVSMTVGPNPVYRSVGSVSIFASGKRLNAGTLTVYDATGNVARKIGIRDNGTEANSRVIGEWDLKDAKGRAVANGTYLLRGVVRTVDGKREKVSVMIGVQ